MNSCELVTLVSFLSCLISNSYDNEELAVLAAVFTQLGTRGLSTFCSF